MTARIVGRDLLVSHTLMVVMALGLVLVTVSVEQAGVPWPDMVRSLGLHCLLALVWLGPVLCGLSTTHTLTRMEHRGELAALACAGVGLSQLRPIVLFVGALMGVLTFTISAVVLPEFTASLTHEWVWTSEGMWHVESQTLIDMQADGHTTRSVLDGAELQRAEPRLAPWAVLQWSGSLGEQVEIVSRVCRVLTCIGFSALGLRAVRWRRPWMIVVGVGVILLAIELMGWAMGAQGRMPVTISGTLGLWVWVGVAWPQPSIRKSRPV